MNEMKMKEEFKEQLSEKKVILGEMQEKPVWAGASEFGFDPVG